ncbi:MAG TPA: gliding motility-associated C-terminal domain-containing protein, partial [Bacteroidales bacterium]|nr:gliding motility-associated C-terminal domain-containing protein [Bacteroidales bacterium]
WYSNTVNSNSGGTEITGATGNSYIPPSTVAGTLYYYCTVSATGDGCGSVTSNTSAVTIVADPSIVTQPVSTITECIGGTTVLSLAAAGGTPSLTYQWYSNTNNSTTGGTPIAGATGTSYTPLSTTAGTLYYYCIVSAMGDGCGSATSSISTVNIISDPSITVNPVSPSPVCVGATLSALTVTATGGTPLLAYQWYSNTVNSVIGGAPISGATSNSYMPLASSAGTLYYYCMVSASGDGCSTATSTTAAVVVVADPAIAANPVSPAAVCVGGTFATLSVTATGGTPILLYQWYYNTTNSTSGGTAIQGATSSSYLPPSTSAGTLYYYCIVSAAGDGCGTAISSTATVTVNSIPTATISGTTQVCKGETSPEITFTGASGIPPYTFTYTMNGSTRTIATSAGSSVATLLVPTSTATTYTYVLISVKDGSSSACSQSQSGTAVVTVNPLPTATISGTTAVCQEASSPLITFTGANGTPPYTFAYTINSVSQSPVTTVSGNSVTVTVPTTNSGTFTYSLVSVTDASTTTCTQSQSGSATVTIYALPADPTISTITAPTCNLATGSVKLTGLPSSGTWILTRYPDLVTKSGTGSFITITGLTSGTYNFKITNSNGCTSALSDDAVIPEQPITPTVVITNPAAVCSPSTVDLTASSITAGSTPGLTYTYWTDAAATIAYATPKAATAGTYYIKGTTSAGCFDIKPVVVTVIQTPAANAGSGGDECDLTFVFNATLSIGTGTWTKISGPGTASFSNANSPTATVTVSSYGTYVFAWTVVNGICSNSATVTVNFYQKPVVTVGTGGNNCGLVAYLEGTTTVGTGTWTMVSGPGTPTYSPNANAPDASVTVSAYGTYSFKWTASNGTCSASATESIKFISMPSANAGSDGVECDLDHVMDASLGNGNTGSWKLVSGTGNAVFSSTTNPTATVTVDKTGSYIFSWTEVNATCSSSDHITVDFRDLPSISAGVDQTICKGSPAQLEAVGDGTFSWQPDSLLSDPAIYNPVATPRMATTFVVRLIDQYGCANKDSVDVFVWTQPVAIAGRDTTLDYVLHTALNASLGANETGRWSIVSGTGVFDDPTDPLTNVRELSVSQNVLRWTVTNNICPESTDDIVILVKDLKFPTLITPNGDEKNEYLILKGLETLEKTEIVVFDRRGTVVYKNSNYNNDWNGVNMNGDPLPDDTYFVVLKGKNGKSISSYLVIRR